MLRKVTRVIHIALQLDTGGMEKLLVEFARHADRTRFDLRFVSMSTRGPVADEIEALGWPVMAMAEPPGLRPGMVLRLAGLFRRWGVDVVHMHNDKALLYCAPAARLAGVGRAVYTRHGERFGATRAQTQVFRMAARITNAIVSVSRESAKQSVREGIHASKVHMIWNGIDVKRFTYLGPALGGPAVMVGRLSPEKDPETAIRAVAIARQSQPDFRLQIAGNGVCLPSLKRIVEDLGIGDAVTFLGNVADVPALLGRSSMCVLSSLTEGISLSLLEAMSRGLPVAATAVGGNPEIVVDGETGFLVAPREPVSLSAAMLKIWRDPELGRKMGMAGRQRVERDFDVRRMVSDYETLYTGELTADATSVAALGIC